MSIDAPNARERERVAYLTASVDIIESELLWAWVQCCSELGCAAHNCRITHDEQCARELRRFSYGQHRRHSIV